MPNTLARAFTGPVVFNTGAHYSAHGQRIAVWIHPAQSGDEICCFVDLDRHISGFFPLRRPSGIHEPIDLCVHALHMYQWGQYDLGGTHEERLAVRAELQAVAAAGHDALVGQPHVTVLTSTPMSCLAGDWGVR